MVMSKDRLQGEEGACEQKGCGREGERIILENLRGWGGGGANVLKQERLGLLSHRLCQSL